MNVTRRELAGTLLLVGLLVATVWHRGTNPLANGLARILNWPAQQAHLATTSNNQPVASEETSYLAADQTLVKKLKLRGVTANVIRRIINPYQRQVLLNCGSHQGLHEGMYAVADGYLVGRVDTVYGDEAWVTLVSDPSFRAGVTIENFDATAILKGNTTSLLVDRIPGQADLRQRLVTTYGEGDYGIAGIPVGELQQEISGNYASGLRRMTLDRPVREEFVGTVDVVGTKDTL